MREKRAFVSDLQFLAVIKFQQKNKDNWLFELY